MMNFNNSPSKLRTIMADILNNQGAAELTEANINSVLPSQVLLSIKWKLFDLNDRSVITSGMKSDISAKSPIGKPFRAGINNLYSTQILFMSSGLLKSGLRISAVSCTYSREDGTFPQLMMTVNQENRPVQLFKHTIPIRLTGNVEFTFNIYLTGIVEKYHGCLSDMYQRNQLWNMAESKHSTDVELVIRRLTFFAHKVILAARSPVFAAMLTSGMTESITNRIKIDDVAPTTFKQFLKFLYTGVYTTEACSPHKIQALFQVADKYQVDTLKQICRYPIIELDSSELTATFFDHRPPGILPRPQPDTAASEEMLEKESSGAVLVFSWKLNSIGADGKAVSKFFSYQHEDIFRAGLIRKNGHPPSQHTLHFVCTNVQKLAIGILNVGYHVSYNEKDALEAGGNRQFMVIEGEDNVVVRFIANLDILRLPCWITFFVEVSEDNTPYEHDIQDALLPTQMLSALQNGLFTDVTFHVGSRQFSAHKVVLSARSTVFDEMFDEDWQESDPIVIDDMDAINFEHFLHFLYTGFLPVSANNTQLKAAAEKYKLVTLKNLCAEADNPMDEEEANSTLLKYWVQTA